MDTLDSSPPPPQSQNHNNTSNAGQSSSNPVAAVTGNSLNTTTIAASTLSSSSLASNLASAGASLSVDQLDIDILPVIYEIIRSIEKDPTEISAKQRESQDCSQKILELQKRLENARQQIRQLPGISYNKEEQLQRLETLRNQLVLKQNLIKKYKHTKF